MSGERTTLFYDRDAEGYLARIDKILRDFATEFAPSPTFWRALFSRSGFETAVKRVAQDPTQRILLLEPPDLYW